MASLRRISYLWKDADAARNYSTGVSLHSHTNQSKETLDFLANLGINIRCCARFLPGASGNRANSHNTPGKLREGVLDATADAAHCVRS